MWWFYRVWLRIEAEDRGEDRGEDREDLEDAT